MKCFNCEMERDCETCLDRISQKKTYSTDISVLERKPPKQTSSNAPLLYRRIRT